MKKNLYYRYVFRRRNIIKETLLDFFYTFCSYPRLLLEVFIKKHFGQRYFSFSSAVIMAVVLFFVPFLLYDFVSSFYGSEFNGFEWSKFFLHFLSWYLFLAAFMYVCLIHRDDIKRSPSVFDFARFSLSSGEPNRVLKKILGKPDNFSPRTQEIVVEPAVFFSLGAVLMIFAQWVGLLLMVSSICYALGWWGAYRRGDDYVMDIIDQMILNEEMEASFVRNETPDNTRGVQFRSQKPGSEELRQRVAEWFVEDDRNETIAK